MVFQMKKLIVLLLLLQSCTTVTHHQREHECSDNCNTFIENMKTFEFDSLAKLSELFNGKEEEVIEEELCEPLGTFSCAAAHASQ